MKVLGLTMIVLCFSLAGFGQTIRLSNHLKVLEQGQGVVRKIRYELVLTRASSLRILQQVERKNRKELPVLHRCIQLCSDISFPEAWHQATEETLGELSYEEKEVLCQVSGILGSGDLKQQEEALRRCEVELKEYVDAAKEKLRTHSKLYNGMGVLTGLMAAVILL